MTKLVVTKEQFIKEMEILEGVDGNIYTVIPAKRKGHEHLVAFRLVAENNKYVILEEEDTL